MQDTPAPIFIYHSSDNTIRQKEMKRPENHPSNFPHDSQLFAHWYYKWDEYNAHLASLKTYACDESCKGLWKDGQEVEEGVDYQVGIRQKIDTSGVINKVIESSSIAFPIQPVQEEGLPTLLKRLQEQEIFFRLENDEDGFYLSIIDRGRYPRIWVDNMCDGKVEVLAESSDSLINRTISPQPDWKERFFGESVDEVLKKYTLSKKQKQ